MGKTDVREWRVSLPVNMRVSVCFRVERTESGWRTGQWVSGRDFRWEIPIDDQSPISANPEKAIEIEHLRLIENLQSTAINALHRQRLVEKIDESVRELKIELEQSQDNEASVVLQHDEGDAFKKSREQKQRSLEAVSPKMHQKGKPVDKKPPHRLRVADVWWRFQMVQRRSRRCSD